MSKEMQFRLQEARCHSVDRNIYNYLQNRLAKLHINMYSEYSGTLIDLMNKGLLNHWCFETAETMSVFLNIVIIFVGGVLKLDDENYLEHSLMCFKYDANEYVLDPCLDILCEREVFDKIFTPRIWTMVCAKTVKEDLLARISSYELSKLTRKDAKTAAEKFPYSMLELLSDEQGNIICVRGDNDITSPMFRNNAGYIAEVENNKIKKLSAHYYLREM